MDQIIKKIAALGVPGLVFMVAIEFSGLVGAAALTTALGPGGIVGGVMTLCVLGVIADGIAEYGFDAIVKGVLKELYCRGESKEGIKEKVSKYPISSKLKSNLYDVVDKFA